ncbi:MAG: DUF3450 domain-containing protein [Pseudodesulfovibrio sp.]
MVVRKMLAVAALLLVPVLARGAATPAQVHDQMAGAVAAEARAQAEYTRWSDEKTGVADEIRDMKAMDDWLDFQSGKYAKYIEKQHAVLAELERRKEEAKRIRMELEPFLETVVDRLAAFVEQDLPFLAEERGQRIAFLRATLDDYHLDLSEKLRRVFEALLVETEYGRNVATVTRVLDLDGAPTQVTVFRLGRTALFYQATDGSSAGTWDRKAGAWTPLDQGVARTLRRAKDMAERKRAVELLELPIGAEQ